MSTASFMNDLAVELSNGLAPSFTVLPADSYVAIVSSEFGIAAVVPSDVQDQAAKAASDLTALAEKAGVVWPSMYFGISVSEVKPPWLVRAGASMCVDIVSAMVRGSTMRPPFSAGHHDAVTDAIRNANTATDTSIAKDPKALSPYLLRLAEVCVEKALGGQTAWIAGVEIDAKDVVGPNFMLPAILVHAAEDWALPVVTSKGKGGFTIRLTPDVRSVLGYRVTNIEISSPVLLFLPMVNLIRRSYSKGECVLDESVKRFAEFLRINGLDTDVIGDVDVRVASTT